MGRVALDSARCDGRPHHVGSCCLRDCSGTQTDCGLVHQPQSRCGSTCHGPAHPLGARLRPLGVMDEPVPSPEPRTHPAETRATCRLAQWLDRQLLLGRVAEVTDDRVELRVARLQPAQSSGARSTRRSDLSCSYPRPHRLPGIGGVTVAKCWPKSPLGGLVVLPDYRGQQQPRAHSYRAAECFDVCIEQLVGPS